MQHESWAASQARLGPAARALIRPHLPMLEVSRLIDGYFGAGTWRELFRGMDPELAALWLRSLVRYGAATPSRRCSAWRLARGLASSRIGRGLFSRRDLYAGLRNRAVANGCSVSQERVTVVLAAMLAAAADADDGPRTVRVGREWVKDASGRKALVEPLLDLSAERAIRWFIARIRVNVEEMVLEDRPDPETVPHREQHELVGYSQPEANDRGSVEPASTAARELDALRHRVTSRQWDLLQALLVPMREGASPAGAKRQAAEALGISVDAVDQHFSRMRRRVVREGLSGRSR